MKTIRTWPWVLLIVLLTTLSVAAVIANKPDYKTILKKFDAQLFDGRLRMLYHGQVAPTEQTLTDIAKSDSDYAWLDEDKFFFIAHATGAHAGSARNDIETFRRSYNRGFRVFEMDLLLTTDDKLICYHGAPGEKISYRTYLERQRKSNRLPCTFDTLIKLSSRHKDARFILDVKGDFEKSYEIIIDELAELESGQSFIPQIYDFEQAKLIRRQSMFAGEIYTSYRSALTTENIFRYARAAGIRAVTITVERFWNSQGSLPDDLEIFTHPVSDAALIEQVKEKGGDGVYGSSFP